MELLCSVLLDSGLELLSGNFEDSGFEELTLDEFTEDETEFDELFEDEDEFFEDETRLDSTTLDVLAKDDVDSLELSLDVSLFSELPPNESESKSESEPETAELSSAVLSFDIAEELSDVLFAVELF